MISEGPAFDATTTGRWFSTARNTETRLWSSGPAVLPNHASLESTVITLGSEEVPRRSPANRLSKQIAGSIRTPSTTKERRETPGFVSNLRGPSQLGSPGGAYSAKGRRRTFR